MAGQVKIFDSTLRDGAQGQGIHFSVEDKVNIACKLDKLGIAYIEAGNPGSNPKDMEFFQRTQRQPLLNAKLVAFGSTRRCDITVQEDQNCQALLRADTECVAIFGKSWDLQVDEVLRTTKEENLSMIGETVAFFKEHGKEVIFDAEHFFDGYKANQAYALAALAAANNAGADVICLCDTNGGSFPEEIAKIVELACAQYPGKVAIHCHNDNGCAVAGSISAVKAGANQVQGTFLGFGERCGNANLSTIIPNLQLKLGYACIPEERMPRLGKTARYIAEIANLVLPNNMPYVGESAFSHKGGMHVDGVLKNHLTFEHIDPQQVGNKRHILLSEVSGRAAVAQVIRAIDDTVTLDSAVTTTFIDKLKNLEYEGYQFESAGASLELFALKHLGRYKPAFELVNFKIIGEQPIVSDSHSVSAMIKVKVGEQVEITAAEGDGPVHALDIALRKVLIGFYPTLSQVRLIDYKVRVVETSAATAAKVRVIIESTDGESVWTTVGLSADIIDASWQALRDSIEYKLINDHAV